MGELDDIELLRKYASNNCEVSFATLVSRHINLVYSTALRTVRNHHQAEEITQAVFVILARKAQSFGSKAILSGWLFHTARLTAANYSRTEMRRIRREQEVFMQSNSADHTSEIWQQIEPMLNDVIADLGEKDRNAIVLKFLEGKPYKEVAAILGATEEAAQMRVNRTLEKLRKSFAKRGVTLTASVLGGMMTAQCTHAAPTGLATSVTTASAQGTALASSTSNLITNTLKIMAWTKIKTTLVIGAAALLVGGTATTIVVSGHSDWLSDKPSKKAAIMKQIASMRLASLAIRTYAAAHNDELPTSLAQLQPYLSPKAEAIDDAHCEIRATGKLSQLMKQSDLGNVVLIQQKGVPANNAKVIVYADGSIKYKK